MMNAMIFARPEGIRAAKPAFTTAAPANPPMRACEELVGIP